MATFKVLVGSVKKDKTFPVLIQIYHRTEKKYLPTGHFVTNTQVSIKKTGKTAAVKLKDEFLIAKLNNDIVGYREQLLKLDLNHVTAEQIKEFLLAKQDKPIEIDFIAFGRTFIEKQSKTTGANTLTVLNSLIDLVGPTLNINHLNLKLLTNFAEYLQSERKAKRDNGRGGLTDYTFNPVSNTAIKDYIGKLRQVFKAAQDHYNDEETGKIVIAHYPFRKFKMPKPKAPKKRNLKPAAIKLIRDATDFSRRADLGRDVFMLSFYLVGVNSADLYNVKEYRDGRLSYYRTKTESRKEEQSFISIKVEPEAIPLIEKYADQTGKRVFNFYHQYRNFDSFNKAVNLGLKTVAENIGKEAIEYLNLGYARGSWSTIARNICKIPKEDIHFALNHSDPDMKVTDLYIEEDFSIVDEANRKVLDTLL